MFKPLLPGQWSGFKTPVSMGLVPSACCRGESAVFLFQLLVVSWSSSSYRSSTQCDILPVYVSVSVSRFLLLIGSYWTRAQANDLALP